jgi:methionine aminopeptidase
MHEPVLTQHDAVAAYSIQQAIALTQAAEQKAWKIIEDMAATLTPGMTEADLRELTQSIFADHGAAKAWHRSYLYFGAHSITTFRDEKPKETLTLQESDIVTLDIGPVFTIDGIDVEGDVGQTFVMGDNPLFHHLKKASEEIFHQARTYWQQHQPTGIELYEHIHRLTQEAGFVFHLEPAGHLIGSFPHTGWKDGLNHYPFIPEPGIWILEVQLRHPTEPYGAFYEAVLA